MVKQKGGNRMKRLGLVLAFIFLVSSILLAENSDFRWGGSGYDPALKGIGRISSKFMARSHSKNSEQIEIWVDSKKTVKEAGRMVLGLDNGKKISSQECWKAMMHLNAPWACCFQKEDIKNFSGIGKVEVSDRVDNILLTEQIDFDKLNNFIVQLDKDLLK